MRRWARYLLCGVVGIATGVGVAVYQVRAGSADVAIGRWTTTAAIDTAHASAKTRAIVAVHGLLALPPGDARDYRTAVDDAGRPLDRRCRYAVSGGPLPARWWSLGTDDGARPLATARVAGRWTAMLAPGPGGHGAVGLVLRTYRPAGVLAAAQLPHIVRERCA